MWNYTRQFEITQLESFNLNIYVTDMNALCSFINVLNTREHTFEDKSVIFEKIFTKQWFF